MDEQLKTLLEDTMNDGLYQAVLSNPRDREKALKIKIRPLLIKGRLLFQAETYKGTQVFHENFEAEILIERIGDALLEDFRQCAIEHRTCRATVLVSKKGRMSVNRKNIKEQADAGEEQPRLMLSHNRVKQYIIEEGKPVPFLVELGVMTKDGRVVRARYDKFKQINRFLEFIRDIRHKLPRERTIHIIDFGCGKSYLTFAMYYYLHDLQGLDVEITGLDLKEDVIARCNELSRKYHYSGLHFYKGDIAAYEGQEEVDMVVTLHACDTATDYALQKAVLWKARVILSVPCCQHEVNGQIHSKELEPVLQYGIIKERMSAPITDAVRAKLLEEKGYETDILEFIDMEHTPKNLLIRAVRKEHSGKERETLAKQEVEQLTSFLGIEPTLQKLMNESDQQRMSEE